MSIISTIYKIYRYSIYEKIDHLRGSTFLLGRLNSLAEFGIERPEMEPQDIFKEEWNNLIILDACRHDIYEEENGDTRARTSLGSCSAEFVKKTFSEGDYEDTVYITANPHFHPSKFQKLTGRLPEDVFHEVYHTYNTDWCHQKGTVLPEPIIRDAKSARRLFPDKKLIVHFMQPDHPFIESSLEVDGLRKDLDNKMRDNIWGLAELGEIGQDILWNEYKNNLRFIMRKIEEVIQGLEGKTVITSDHGNFMGENGLYHHPCGCKSTPVRKVPWDVREE